MAVLISASIIIVFSQQDNNIRMKRRNPEVFKSLILMLRGSYFGCKFIVFHISKNRIYRP